VEKKVTIYDPSINAYREVSIERAKKFVESAKEVEKKIKQLEK
jgi:flagellar hook-associated protein FlgK